MSMSGEYEAYTAFSEGMRLLADDNAHAAVIALEQARALEPTKGSVREALARAYFVKILRDRRAPHRARYGGPARNVSGCHKCCGFRPGDRVGECWDRVGVSGQRRQSVASAVETPSMPRISIPSMRRI